MIASECKIDETKDIYIEEYSRKDCVHLDKGSISKTPSGKSGFKQLLGEECKCIFIHDYLINNNFYQDSIRITF